jgi:uncharacterized protein (TIGR02246 family)
MRRLLLCIGVLVGLSAVVLQSVLSQSQPTRHTQPSGKSGQKDDKAPPADDQSPDEAAINANIEQFEKAYNAHDAKGLAALFTTDGQVIDKDGTTAEGREAIEKVFADIFAETPQKHMEIYVESLRFLGKDLAMEVGTTEETDEPNEPPDVDRYTVIHVKRDGKWLMAMARDEEGPPDSAHEQLKPIAWLVGDWIDDGGSSVVRSSCRWSEDGNWLLQEFRLQINGRNMMNVSQRIGWNPIAKRIHSWVFDSEGGYGESEWTRDGDGWIIRATGVRPDGTTASATNFLTQAGNDGYIWRSTDRIVGDALQPPTEVKVVRKPPQPK